MPCVSSQSLSAVPELYSSLSILASSTCLTLPIRFRPSDIFLIRRNHQASTTCDPRTSMSSLTNADTIHATGRCVCGKHQFTVHGRPINVANCHCQQCRSHSGVAPFSTWFTVDKDQYEGSLKEVLDVEGGSSSPKEQYHRPIS